MKPLAILFSLVVASGIGPCFAKPMSFSEITEKLFDLQSLAQPPHASERSGSFSSRDRRSIYNPDTKCYEQWFNNDDGSGFLRDENGDIVAAEMSGPGVIWRTWSAMPQDGLMKIYIDGKSEPVLSMPFKDYFDPTKEPFNYPELVRDNARGKNSYIPIVYQKSCKVVLCRGWGKYYQISYSSFPEDVVVSSFSGRFDDHEKAALQKANRIWADRQPTSAAQEMLTKKNITINPGEEVELLNSSDPAAITAFFVPMPGMMSAVEPDPANAKQTPGEVLRQLTLSIYWDGEKRPSVWTPLGDFFGTAPGVNMYRSLPLGMTPEHFYSYWYMPFNSARIILKNEGLEARELNVRIVTQPLAESQADRLLRFHAKWHRDHYAPHGRDRLMSDRWPDWMVLYARNTAGRFCGFSLHIWNPLHMWDETLRNRYQWSFPDHKSFAEGTPMHVFFKNDVLGQHYWWGEGDEKFFVDGEAMPSTFGTGSEDYFGYAWGTPQKYESAVQCQTLNHENTGHISVCRWQIADNIPFQKSFEACIEKYHDNNWPLLYAATAYWYQERHTEDSYAPVPVEERVGYYAMPKERTAKN